MLTIPVLCDDVWHPADVLERGLALLDQDKYQFDFIKTCKDICTPEFAANFPLIITCKSNNVNAANSEPWFEDTVTEFGPREMKAYMENGGNMIFIHSASAFSGKFIKKGELFETPNDLYIKLVGNDFSGHPLRCPVTVHVTNPDHPIMKEVHDFTERDEHYQCRLTVDADVFMETSSDHGDTVVSGYTRKIGKGTQVVLTPGHTLAVWSNENWKKIILNSIEYCLGGTE